MEDTTGGGEYDQSTLFAKDIPFPNGITVWRDGVIVTCAPKNIYLEDANNDGQGHAVGPDLAALSDKSHKTLLLSILDPSRAIDARYLNYVALADEGRSYTGILVQESGTSITLKAQDGKDQVILRDSLETLQFTGKSMMPEGMEKDMTPQELADLITYVAGPRTRVAVPAKSDKQPDLQQ